MKSLKESTKIINSIVLGIMGFFGVFLSLNFSSDLFAFTMHWTFLFPLMAGMAYGGRYGMVSGIFGLGAFFPLVLWPANGWGNLITIALYIVFFAYQGYFEKRREKSHALWNRPAIAFIPFSIFYAISTYALYPLAFRYNPPFWTSIVHKSISGEVLKKIIAKEIVLIFFILILANTLLRINSVRKILGLNKKTGYRRNGWIFLSSVVFSVTFWIIYVLFTNVFIDGNFQLSNILVSNGYVLIGLMVSIFFAVSIACLGMELAEHNNTISEMLKLRERQIRSIGNNLTSGILYQVLVDSRGNKRITFASDSVVNIMGFTPEQLYRDFSLFYKNVFPEDLPKLVEAENVAIKNLTLFKCNIRTISKNGDICWHAFVSTPTQIDNGSIVWDGIVFDISEQVEIQEALEIEKEKLKSKQEHIEYLSFHDQLTDLYNRRFYVAELDRLDHPRNYPIAIIVADVNGLKMINDAFGHEAGDELIIQVAEVFKSVCRADDIAARIGGDEFILLLPKTDQNEAEHIIKRLREAYYNIEHSNVVVSVSFGLGVKSDENDSMNDVFTNAEDEMYRNKLTESKSMRSETIKIIVHSLREKRSMEKIHAENVSQLSRALAKAYGLDSEKVKGIGLAGLLHDIGKIGIDESLLSKEGTMDEREWDDVKRHSEIGYQIIRSINNYAEIAEIILAHHERIDGNGYPRHLKGDEIPLQSRILMIADAYDAMTEYRPYKDELTKEEAAEELILNSGTQFDEKLVKIFVEKVLNLEWHKKMTEEVNLK